MFFGQFLTLEISSVYSNVGKMKYYVFLLDKKKRDVSVFITHDDNADFDDAIEEGSRRHLSLSLSLNIWSRTLDNSLRLRSDRERAEGITYLTSLCKWIAELRLGGIVKRQTLLRSTKNKKLLSYDCLSPEGTWYRIEEVIKVRIPTEKGYSNSLIYKQYYPAHQMLRDMHFILHLDAYHVCTSSLLI